MINVASRIRDVDQRMCFQSESKHFTARNATDVERLSTETDTDTQTRETAEAEPDVAPVAAKKVSSLTPANTIVEFQEVYGGSYERARQLWHEAGGKEHKDIVLNLSHFTLSACNIFSM